MWWLDFSSSDFLRSHFLRSANLMVSPNTSRDNSEIEGTLFQEPMTRKEEHKINDN